MMGSTGEEDPPSPSSSNVDSADAIAVEFGKLNLEGSFAGNVNDAIGGAKHDDDDGGGVGEEEFEGDGAAGKTEKKEGDGRNGMKRMKKKKKKKEKQKEGGGSVSIYPQRPDEPDCAYYMKNGACKYGMNCRYNHPLDRGNHHQVASNKDKEALPERVGEPECKYYLKTGTCKFEGACKYHHPREKAGNEGNLELNFLGLPIRQGEKECPFYMRTGSCKYAANCRFHHPDPTAIRSSVPVSGYQRGESFLVHPPEASPPYMHVMLPSHPTVLPNPGWNGYPASSGQILPPPAATMNEQAAKMADYASSQHQQEPLEDFPERPGQLECQFYLKTGTCKFRSACSYHHPKSRPSKPPMCTLSPMGLPLRPDQMVCLHYSRFGICKFGPACKFDHSPTYGYQDPPAASVNGQSEARDPSTSLDGRNVPHSNSHWS